MSEVKVARGPRSGRPPPRPIVVKRVTRLSSRMVGVTFVGADASFLNWNGPASYIKLAFPGPGESEPRLPSPEGPRPLMRTFTPRRVDATSLELDVEFVLHGHGPASQWAAQASVGQKLLVGGPGRSYSLDASAPWFLLMGDDSALPAIATLLEAVPAATPVLVRLAVAARDEQRAFVAADILARPSLDLQWLHFGSDAERAGALLEQAAQQVQLPAGGGCIYVACEAAATRRIRAHFLGTRGVAPTLLTTRGYWKLNASNHPDHDYGEDEG